MSHSGESGITTAVRFRPLNGRELAASGGDKAWETMSSERTVVMLDETGKPTTSERDRYTYDHAFGEETKTVAVYDAVAREIVQGAMQGINGTIFAYGQTSSGKTHTMHGAGGEGGELGLLQLAAHQIFDYIEATPARQVCFYVLFQSITEFFINLMLLLMLIIFSRKSFSCASRTSRSTTRLSASFLIQRRRLSRSVKARRSGRSSSHRRSS